MFLNSFIKTVGAVDTKIKRAILPKSLEYKLGVTKKPKPFEFKIGENLTPEQTKIAEAKVREPFTHIYEQVKLPYIQKEFQVEKNFLGGFVKYNVELPEKISGSLKQIPEAISNFGKIKDRTGKVYKVSTYQEDAKEISEAIVDGKLPLAYGLLPFVAVPLDLTFASNIIRAGYKSILSGVKVPTVAHQGAWEYLGRPNNLKEASREVKQLQGVFHPDMGLISNAAKSVEVNQAYTILKKLGIPKQTSKLTSLFKKTVETLESPVGKLNISINKGVPYANTKALIPEQAGTIPTQPFQPYSQPSMGLSIRDIKARPIEGRGKLPVSQPLAKGISKEEWIKGQTRKFKIDFEVEPPVRKAVEVLPNTSSSGFHGAWSKDFNGIDPSWGIIVDRKLTNLEIKSLEGTGLKYKVRKPIKGNDEYLLTDIYLPNVKESEVVKVTQAFDKFAENYQLKTPSQFSSLYDEAAKASQPLALSAQEALAKGISKEAWIKGQGETFYHGTDRKFTEFDPYAKPSNKFWGTKTEEEGVWFTKSKMEAKSIGKNVIEAKVEIKNPRIINNQDLFNSEGLRASEMAEASGSGNDALILKADNGQDWIWIPAKKAKKAIKTRSQLSSLYNEATKGKAITSNIRKIRAAVNKGESLAKLSFGDRRIRLRVLKDRHNLIDSDISKIRAGRDITAMTKSEFDKFIEEAEKKAIKIAERRQAMNELGQQIRDKELDIENLRKAMKLPTMKNMAVEDIKKLDEALRPFHQGDVFLSVRKLETVDRTELKGIKTWREARGRLAKRLGVPLESLSNIKVSEFDRFRWDQPLARRNPFYAMMVEEKTKRLLISEKEYLDIEEKTLALAKKLKTKGLVGKIIPQQKNIRAYMEAPIDKKAGIELTQDEFSLVKLMTEEFSKARDYLIKVEAMEGGRKNYFTHIRRGILEAVKEDGLVKAVKEVFTKYKQEEQNFEILDKQTGQILALDKFFKFAMHRTGQLIPTENTVRAFLTYMKMFKKKQSLDEIVPLIDIYAHSLTPTGTTKTGVLLHGDLITFVKEWLNTQKGRHITLIAKQGGKIDGTLRAIKMFTTLRDLGINVAVSIATQIGEQVTTYQLLGKRNYLKGKIRQNTKQGKLIISRYREIIGKNPWKELIEPAKDIGDRLMEGIFILFRDSTVRANKTFLLGSLSKEEFRAGEVSPDRLTKLKLELGRYRQVDGVTSIIGATPEGKSYTQYKKWALPILDTTLNNIKNLFQLFSKQRFASGVGKKSALELYRLIELTAIVIIIRHLIGGIDDNDTFIGRLKSKAYREITTLIQALNPKLFLAAGRTASFVEDFGVALNQLIKLEKYKTKTGLKGVEALKRLVKPVAINQFSSDKGKTSSENKIKDLNLNLDLDFKAPELNLNLDLGL